MAEHMDSDLAAAIRSLERAASKLQFVAIASQLEEIKSLGPEEFLAEIQEDIDRATASVARLREGFLSRMV